MKASHACDKEHPKPNENVDLLVNNIEWKHTKAVEFLFSGGSTNAMKCTTEIKKMRNFENQMGNYWYMHVFKYFR